MSQSVISILLPDLRGGGAERVNLDLASEFSKMGHAVEFVLMQARGELLSDALSQFSVVDLGVKRARQVPLALAKYLRNERPDALLAAMWPLTAIAPLMRLVGYRGRIVVSEHSLLSMQYDIRGRVHQTLLRGSIAVSYRLADALVAVSGGVAGDLSALSGLPLKSFEVVHNPVPIRPSPVETVIRDIEALWSSPHGTRIVTVGSLKASKNHNLLLRAFARLARSDARLMLVGTGTGEADLRNLAAELAIVDRVIFVGFHADPTPFYCTADLFVLSSNYEGFGNVIVEALACGTPVVSTDCPSGPAEILAGGKFGTLVPVGDVGALAAAIDTALSSPHDTDALRRRATDFAPGIAAKRYLDLLARP